MPAPRTPWNEEENIMYAYVADYHLNREEEGIQNASKYFHGSQPRVCVGCEGQQQPTPCTHAVLW